jgi:RHS repeat-associated protein
VTPLLHYEPLGRLISTALPAGSTSRVEVSPWFQRSYDPNHTTAEPDWRADERNHTGAFGQDAADEAVELSQDHVEDPPPPRGEMRVLPGGEPPWGTLEVTPIDAPGRAYAAVEHDRAARPLGDVLYDRRATVLPDDIAYDEKGRRTKSVDTDSRTSSGDFPTEHTYDAQIHRVVETKGKSDALLFQRFAHHYDPPGNITFTKDASRHDLYFTPTDRNVPRELGVPQDTRTNDIGLREYDQTYTYDAVRNLLSMHPQPIGGGTIRTRAHNYARGSCHSPAVHRSYDRDVHKVAMLRKVWRHGQYRDETLYLGGFEVWRRYEVNASVWTLEEERETVHVSDDARRICMIETETISGGSPVSSPAPRYRFQLDDHLGTVAVEVDATGNVISYEQYHPYGTSAYRAQDGTLGVSAKRYRYNGKERDDETKLYYYGARYYAPWLGRWTAADPLAFADGVGAYTYVRGSPVVLSDPNGKQGKFIWPEDWDIKIAQLKAEQLGLMGAAANAEVVGNKAQRDALVDVIKAYDRQIAAFEESKRQTQISLEQFGEARRGSVRPTLAEGGGPPSHEEGASGTTPYLAGEELRFDGGAGGEPPTPRYPQGDPIELHVQANNIGDRGGQPLRITIELIALHYGIQGLMAAGRTAHAALTFDLEVQMTGSLGMEGMAFSRAPLVAAETTPTTATALTRAQGTLVEVAKASDAERAFANEFFVNRGYDVTLAGLGTEGADLTVSVAGRQLGTFELKQLTTANPSKIATRIREGLTQGENVIIDLRASEISNVGAYSAYREAIRKGFVGEGQSVRIITRGMDVTF